LERGFLIANLVLIAVGIWCLFVPVLRQWPSAPAIVTVWSLVELGNGIGHPAWSVIQGGYTPGVATAPILLVLALLLLSARSPADPPTSHA
jgi:hypothetical protein